MFLANYILLAKLWRDYAKKVYPKLKQTVTFCAIQMYSMHSLKTQYSNILKTPKNLPSENKVYFLISFKNELRIVVVSTYIVTYKGRYLRL